MSRIRGVVLDRDGTLIEHEPYLSDPGLVRLLPTVVPGLKTLRKCGCVLFLHTNQSGIGRGYFSHNDAVACNSAMVAQIGLGEDLFKRICIAPDHPGPDTGYRKPSPKFGREIVEDYAIQMNELCYIGDNITDLLTAKALGCEGVGVTTGRHDLRSLLQDHNLAGYFPVFETFVEAANYIRDSRPVSR